MTKEELEQREKALIARIVELIFKRKNAYMVPLKQIFRTIPIFLIFIILGAALLSTGLGFIFFGIAAAAFVGLVIYAVVKTEDLNSGYDRLIALKKEELRNLPLDVEINLSADNRKELTPSVVDPQSSHGNAMFSKGELDKSAEGDSLAPHDSNRDS